MQVTVEVARFLIIRGRNISAARSQPSQRFPRCTVTPSAAPSVFTVEKIVNYPVTKMAWWRFLPLLDLRYVRSTTRYRSIPTLSNRKSDDHREHEPWCFGERYVA
jgi:hypothetical protein